MGPGNRTQLCQEGLKGLIDELVVLSRETYASVLFYRMHGDKLRFAPIYDNRYYVLPQFLGLGSRESICGIFGGRKAYPARLLHLSRIHKLQGNGKSGGMIRLHMDGFKYVGL